MQYNLIGAGRLGKNIALSLSTSDRMASFSVCNRSQKSTQKACLDLGFALPVERIALLPPAEVTWISCKDDAIQAVAELLAKHRILKPGSLVIHCSGVLDSSVLAPLKKQGCSIASFHPLKAFKTNYLDPQAFNQVHCVLEGDLSACNWLRACFEGLGAHLTAINPQAKSIYHAAACMASNYLITLASCSEELFLKAGINQQKSRRMLVHLMQGNLTNLQASKNLSEALTGPLARGDSKTIARHLAAIENLTIKNLYKTAARRTLDLTPLNQKLKEKIKILLDKH